MTHPRPGYRSRQLGALSDEEISANQLQVDSSLEAINRIAQTTTFQGRRLLDGSLDFVSTIGSVSTVRDSRIDQANLGATGSVTVDVNITTAATQAELTLADTAFSAATAANATNSIAQKTYTLNVGGETLEIVGANDFDQIENHRRQWFGCSRYSVVRRRQADDYLDGDSNPSDLADVATAVNGVAGFVAGTPAAPPMTWHLPMLWPLPTPPTTLLVSR